MRGPDMTSTYVDDSDQPRCLPARELTDVWAYRGLLKLLIGPSAADR
jgi:hypothetical protein